MDTPTPPPPALPPCPLGQPEVTDLPDVDLHALRANLQLTPDERLRKLEQHNHFIRQLIQAREDHKHSKAQSHLPPSLTSLQRLPQSMIVHTPMSHAPFQK